MYLPAPAASTPLTSTQVHNPEDGVLGEACAATGRGCYPRRTKSTRALTIGCHPVTVSDRPLSSRADTDREQSGTEKSRTGFTEQGGSRIRLTVELAWASPRAQSDGYQHRPAGLLVHAMYYAEHHQDLSRPCSHASSMLLCSVAGVHKKKDRQKGMRSPKHHLP